MVAARKYRTEGGCEIDDAAIEKMAEPWDRGEVPEDFSDLDAESPLFPAARDALTAQEPPAEPKTGKE